MTQLTSGAEHAPTGPVAQFLEFFRAHWSRGPAGRETPRWVLLMAYRTWLIALLCKMLGSSWDMSWHFKWLRDDLAPPHLINTVGTGIVIVLVTIHTFTGYGCDRRSLRLMQSGIAVFLIAAPLDVINHRINGLDLTAWSPSHMLLYIGTALMIAGVIDGWCKLAPVGRVRTVVLTGLWVFFLENAMFPNGQQEYGWLELQAWLRGEPQAEPTLLQFAAGQFYGLPDPQASDVRLDAVLHFALPTGDWVYPMWGIGIGALVLAIAGRTIGGRWSATVVAGGYVAYRAVIWPLLAVGGFPPSTVPFYLVFVGLAVDITRRLRLGRLARPVVGAAAVTGFGYLALFAQDRLVAAPPVGYWTAPVTFGCVALLWFAGSALSRRASGRPSAGARTPA